MFLQFHGEWSSRFTVYGAHPTSATTRAEYVDRVCAGGFPLALRRTSGAARNRWFDDYITQSIERDAIELARIRQRQLLRELLGRLAGRTGQVLNLSAASEGLGLARTTAEEHTRLLEDLFLLERLPAWGKTLRARTIAAPKVHVIDSGVVARLLRVSPDKLAGLDPTTLTEFGNLLETFVVGELRKQASWLDESVTAGHWRTHDGDEVDYVMEFDDGRILAFEWPRWTTTSRFTRSSPDPGSRRTVSGGRRRVHTRGAEEAPKTSVAQGVGSPSGHHYSRSSDSLRPDRRRDCRRCPRSGRAR